MGTNNLVKWYSSFIRLDFIVSLGIHNVIIVGDFLLVISQTRKMECKEDMIVGRVQLYCIVDLLPWIKAPKSCTFVRIITPWLIVF